MLIKPLLPVLPPFLATTQHILVKHALCLYAKKRCVSKLSEIDFTDKSPIDKWYPEKDYNNMIIGKIEKVLVKE